MADFPAYPEQEDDKESFPVQPRYHPVHKIPRRVYDFLASARLAMTLLVIILACCLAGVTIWKGVDAGRVIFGTIWFNSILVLLVVNVACCFFPRIWGRRITIVSFGMILFHLSFVVMLLAISFNSLFYFRGIIRLTEGESLPSSDIQSYDSIDKGRFFRFSRLRGETSLIKMHTGYKVSGENKRAAYEVAIGEPKNRTEGIIYITHGLSHQGVRYFNEKEGYSLLLVLSDRQGNDLYGAHVPLQSRILGKDKVEYFTGYRTENEIRKDLMPFPAPPEKPLFALQAEYTPSRIRERGGDVKFLLYPLDEKGSPKLNKVLSEGKAAIGDSFSAGEYFLTTKEVRYWVGMRVSYEPGQPIVLTSLWIGLAGLIITFAGRMSKKRN